MTSKLPSEDLRSVGMAPESMPEPVSGTSAPCLPQHSHLLKMRQDFRTSRAGSQGRHHLIQMLVLWSRKSKVSGAADRTDTGTSPHLKLARAMEGYPAKWVTSPLSLACVQQNGCI